jgi:hypothetical protein
MELPAVAGRDVSAVRIPVRYAVRVLGRQIPVVLQPGLLRAAGNVHGDMRGKKRLVTAAKPDGV